MLNYHLTTFVCLVLFILEDPEFPGTLGKDVKYDIVHINFLKQGGSRMKDILTAIYCYIKNIARNT